MNGTVTCHHCEFQVPLTSFVSHCMDVHRISYTDCPLCFKKFRISNYFSGHLKECYEKHKNGQTTHTVPDIPFEFGPDSPPQFDDPVPDIPDNPPPLDFFDDLKRNFFLCKKLL